MSSNRPAGCSLSNPNLEVSRDWGFCWRENDRAESEQPNCPPISAPPGNVCSRAAEAHRTELQENFSDLPQAKSRHVTPAFSMCDGARAHRVTTHPRRRASAQWRRAASTNPFAPRVPSPRTPSRSESESSLWRLPRAYRE